MGWGAMGFLKREGFFLTMVTSVGSTVKTHKLNDWMNFVQLQNQGSESVQPVPFSSVQFSSLGHSPKYVIFSTNFSVYKYFGIQGMVLNNF
jgi:hypothetical protein